MDVLSFSTAEASDAALRLHLAAARAVRFCLALQASTALHRGETACGAQKRVFLWLVCYVPLAAASRPKKASTGLCNCASATTKCSAASLLPASLAATQ